MDFGLWTLVQVVVVCMTHAPGTCTMIQVLYPVLGVCHIIPSNNAGAQMLTVPVEHELYCTTPINRCQVLYDIRYCRIEEHVHCKIHCTLYGREITNPTKCYPRAIFGKPGALYKLTTGSGGRTLGHSPKIAAN